MCLFDKLPLSNITNTQFQAIQHDHSYENPQNASSVGGFSLAKSIGSSSVASSVGGFSVASSAEAAVAL